MNDFLMWFVTKHWIVASVLFPEMMLAWAVWMKLTVWAVVLAIGIVCVRGSALIAAIAKLIRS